MGASIRCRSRSSRTHCRWNGVPTVTATRRTTCVLEKRSSRWAIGRARTRPHWVRSLSRNTTSGPAPTVRRVIGDPLMSTDIQALRAKLQGTRGREYWRSLEAVAETPEFKEYLHREFPQNASEWLDPVGRRGFLKLMGASMALAGVSACTRQPEEAIIPYVRQPEELVPGKPLFYATAMPFAGAGVGLLVENHEGRPTKIEGNPDHPTSRGATDLFAQAAILGLYDPDRSQTITHLGEIRTFEAFVAAVREVLDAQQSMRGSGLRILSETVTSPTLNAQIDELLGRFPQAKWAQWEPFGRHNAREGSRLAFGEYVDPQYAIEKADVVLSLDADFLCTGSSGLK